MNIPNWRVYLHKSETIMKNSNKNQYHERDTLTELQEYQWNIPQQNEIANQIYILDILNELPEQNPQKQRTTIH